MKLDYSKEALIRAITDLLDGQSKWYEIKEHTGVGEERARELEAIADACFSYDRFSHIAGRFSCIKPPQRKALQALIEDWETAGRPAEGVARRAGIRRDTMEVLVSAGCITSKMAGSRVDFLYKPRFKRGGLMSKKIKRKGKPVKPMPIDVVNITGQAVNVAKITDQRDQYVITVEVPIPDGVKHLPFVMGGKSDLIRLSGMIMGALFGYGVKKGEENGG